MTFKPNQANFDRLLTGQTGPVFRHVKTMTNNTKAFARLQAPRDTGKLYRSIQSEGPASNTGSDVHSRVGTSIFYGRIVHQGRKAIHPINAPALVFFWKAKKAVVRVGPMNKNWKFVRARAGRPFLFSAMEAANNLFPAGQRFRIKIIAKARKSGS